MKYLQQLSIFVVLKYVSQISSIIVALLFVYTTNFKSFVTASYFINQAEIIELFCINKEKPQLQCDGKCHLATQLAEVENDTEDEPFSPNNISYQLDINLSLLENGIDITPKNNEIIETKFACKTPSVSDGYYSILSPPPKS